MSARLEYGKRAARPNTRERWGVLTLVVAMAWFGPAINGSAQIQSKLFGPKLLYYPLECHNLRGCRIECYQNGTVVASRLSIAQNDTVSLVVNAGISDEVIPRWIEIRAFEESRNQTILLSPNTTCDLQSLTIGPEKTR